METATPAPVLIDSVTVASRLKVHRKTVLGLAQRRLLPKIKPHSRSVLFPWDQVKLVLAKMTLWELAHEGPRVVSDQLCTIPELMAELSITRKQIHSLTAHRYIPSIRLGRSTRYDPAGVRYALENLISVRDCARRLGLSRWQLDGMSGPGRAIPVIRTGKRCLRYHWPTVKAAIENAGRKATLVRIDS